MIEIADRIALDEAEIVVTFIRASGPGGQNVNKVSSAAQLRFDVRRSPSLPDAVRLHLERIAGARITKDGEIVLTAGNFCTQEANRRDALNRLVRRRLAQPLYIQLRNLSVKAPAMRIRDLSGAPSTVSFDPNVSTGAFRK